MAGSITAVHAKINKTTAAAWDELDITTTTTTTGTGGYASIDTNNPPAGTSVWSISTDRKTIIANAMQVKVTDFEQVEAVSTVYFVKDMHKNIFVASNGLNTVGEVVGRIFLPTTQTLSQLFNNSLDFYFWSPRKVTISSTSANPSTSETTYNSETMKDVIWFGPQLRVGFELEYALAANPTAKVYKYIDSGFGTFEDSTWVASPTTSPREQYFRDADYVKSATYKDGIKWNREWNPYGFPNISATMNKDIESAFAVSVSTMATSVDFYLRVFFYVGDAIAIPVASNSNIKGFHYAQAPGATASGQYAQITLRKSSGSISANFAIVNPGPNFVNETYAESTSGGGSNQVFLVTDAIANNSADTTLRVTFTNPGGGVAQT